MNNLKNLGIRLLPPILLDALRQMRSAEFVKSDKIVASDEYINWLCTVVGGWLTPRHGNIRAFEHAIRNLPVQGAIIEVGSFLGLSTNLIAYFMAKYTKNNPFFICDPWVFEETDKKIGGYFDASSQAFSNYAQAVFKLNCQTFSQNHYPFAIKVLSDDFFAQWKINANLNDVFDRTVSLGGAIAFAYIDGAHTYEATQKDFANVDQWIVPGGFILFDDSADGCGYESSIVAKEIMQNSRYRLVFKTPHYFFQCLR
ncbi:MAG: class I SAM-dependent methyltransferase [Anaerolineae bacterium]|nr:class I SAM-dependent methyltransferase [Anaerolineae bacterium]